MGALLANQGHLEETGGELAAFPLLDADPFARNLTIATFVTVGLGALLVAAAPAVVYAFFARDARLGEGARLLGEEAPRDDERAPPAPRLATRMAF